MRDKKAIYGKREQGKDENSLFQEAPFPPPPLLGRNCRNEDQRPSRRGDTQAIWGAYDTARSWGSVAPIKRGVGRRGGACGRVANFRLGRHSAVAEATAGSDSVLYTDLLPTYSQGRRHPISSDRCEQDIGSYMNECTVHTTRSPSDLSWAGHVTSIRIIQVDAVSPP
jgi:hypothetical protein